MRAQNNERVLLIQIMMLYKQMIFDNEIRNDNDV